MFLKPDMNMKNNYVVRVLDLPEHERVILKLIFSISEKSPQRNNSYTLASDLHEPADVLIRDARSAFEPMADVRFELLVADSAAVAIHVPVILRPLIATRVLAVLDDVFTATHSRSSVVPFIAQPPADAGLAIALEQAQEHPANHAAPGIPVSQGPDVAAVIDTILLSPPSEAPAFDIFVEEDTAPAAVAETKPAAVTKPRVLVVDDSAAVCKQIAIELQQFSVEVDYVPSARKAIEMIAKGNYRLAFLDVVLPDWDGFKICKHIKSKSPGTTVVMLTEKATTGDKLRGALAGCDAYLVKPVGRQTFQAEVKKYLPLASSTQALGA